MVNVVFYNFTKYHNSTKRPAPTAGLEVSCLLKEPCSLEKPHLEITENTAIIDKNYCYIADFNRYYYINDITFDKGLWVLDLSIDVLATYRAEIGSKEMYTLRASARGNGAISDTLFPITATTSKARYTIREAEENTFLTGYYVVNVMGNNTGSSTLYQLTPANFSTLLNLLFTSLDGISWTDIGLAIKNLIFKPLDYINSVMWFPEAFSGENVSTVDIGPWSANIGAVRITDPVKAVNITGSTPVLTKHPQAARGKYLNTAPYTQYNVVFPPFGIIPIDTTKVIDDSYISLSCQVDALTGVGILRGRTAESGGHELFMVTAQYGVQLPLKGNGGGSVSGLLSSALSAGIGLATGNAIVTAGGISAGVGTIADGILNPVSQIGSSGSIVAHNLPRYLDAQFYHIAGDDWSDCGYPLCLDIAPADIGGYILPKNPHVSINGTAEEAAELQSRLERGFFYE